MRLRSSNSEHRDLGLAIDEEPSGPRRPGWADGL